MSTDPRRVKIVNDGSAGPIVVYSLRHDKLEKLRVLVRGEELHAIVGQGEVIEIRQAEVEGAK